MTHVRSMNYGDIMGKRFTLVDMDNPESVGHSRIGVTAEYNEFGGCFYFASLRSSNIYLISAILSAYAVYKLAEMLGEYPNWFFFIFLVFVPIINTVNIIAVAIRFAAEIPVSKTTPERLLKRLFRHKKDA